MYFFFNDFTQCSLRSRLCINVHPPLLSTTTSWNILPSPAEVFYCISVPLPWGPVSREQKQIQATTGTIFFLAQDVHLLIHIPMCPQREILAWVRFCAFWQTSPTNCEVVRSCSQKTITTEFSSIPVGHLKILFIPQISGAHRVVW